MPHAHLSIRLTLSCLALISCGCHLLPDVPDPLNLPGAKARNLQELHADTGEYKYSATLLGDFGYLLESFTGRDRSDSLSPSAVANPAEEVLANLVELMEANPTRGNTGDLQLQWCARLCASDPSALVRERAAIGLGEVGVWAGVSQLRPAQEELAFATPQDIGAALEALLRGLRLLRDGEDDGSLLAEACREAKGLHLNVEGAWRLLSVQQALQSQTSSASSKAELQSLASHLRVRLVEEGLYSALSDPSDLVRSAGLRSTVKLFGPGALVGYLSQPMPGWSDAVILGLVDLVAEHGLPDTGQSAGLRSRCIVTLLSWAMDHPAERVRARSMLALQRVAPDGPASLREEEWRHWAQSVGLWATASA